MIRDDEYLAESKMELVLPDKCVMITGADSLDKSEEWIAVWYSVIVGIVVASTMGFGIMILEWLK